MSLFPIQTRTGHGLIDRDGRVVVEPTLKSLAPFSDGLAAASVDYGRTGFVDETGKFRIEPRFGSVGRFSEGLCAVTNASGKAAFIDKDGREVFALEDAQRFFEELVFTEGRCRTTKDGWSGYVDREGRVVVPHRYANAGPFHEGLAAVAGERESFGYIDADGNVVFAPRWERAWSFRNGLAAVVSDLRVVDGPILRQFKKDLSFEELRGLWGLIDREGNYRCLPSFDYSETELATTMAFLGDPSYGPAEFSEGLALVRRKKKWGFVAESGEIAIEPAFEKAAHFRDGLAAVQKKMKGGARWGFVDRSGTMKIAPAFSRVLWPRVYFEEGLCAVGVPIEPERAQAFAKVGVFTDALYGFIDTSGAFVIEPAFAYPTQFRDGLAAVKTPTGSAYIDRKGTIVWSES